MIELTYGEIIGLIIFVSIISMIINDRLNYREKKKEEYTTCDYTVVSKKTGIEYNCIGIRNRSYNTEILIYNHISQNFEWWSIYQFDFIDK